MRRTPQSELRTTKIIFLHFYPKKTKNTCVIYDAHRPTLVLCVASFLALNLDLDVFFAITESSTEMCL